MNDNKAPDLIHIISKAGTFSVELNITGYTIIDSSTMKSPDVNNTKFPGFVKGDLFRKVMIPLIIIKPGS